MEVFPRDCLYINYFCPSRLSIIIQALAGDDGLRLGPRLDPG
jgi:hypothetical protein